MAEPSQLDLLLEAERRGIELPANKAALLAEARRRGIVPAAVPASSTPVGQEKTWGQAASDFVREEGPAVGLGMLGAAEGAALGAPFFPPLGAALGAVGGAYIGGSAGGAVREATDALAGQEKPASEVLANVQGSGQYQAQGEAIGRPLGFQVGQAAQKILPPIIERGSNVARAVKAAISENISPTVAQITQSRPWARAEEVLAGLPLFGQRILKMRQAQEDAYQAIRSRAIETAGPRVVESDLGAQTQRTIEDALARKAEKRHLALTQVHGQLLQKGGNPALAEQIGQEIEKARILRTEQARITGEKLYRQVDDLIPPEGDRVVDTNLKAAADRILERFKNLPRESLDGKTWSFLQDLRTGPGNKVIENAPNPITIFDAQGQPASVVKAMSERKAYTFQEMRTLRSALNGLIDEAKTVTGQGTRDGAVYSELKKAVEADIDTFGKGLGGDLRQKFDLATAYWRDTYHGIYGSQTLKNVARIAANNPEDVYKAIVQPGDVSDIRMLKKAIGENGMAGMRRRFIEDLVTAPDGSILDSAAINRNIARNTMATMQEILTPEQMKAVAGYAKNRAESPKFIEKEIEKKLRRLVAGPGGTRQVPSSVVSGVVNGDVMLLRAVKNVVGKEGLAPYRRAVVESILGPAHDPRALPGQIPTASAMKIGKALREYDEKFLGHLFNQEELAQIDKIDTIKALLESQPKLMANASNTAATGASLLGVGGIGYLLGRRQWGAAAAAVASSELMTRMYTSPAVRRILVEGIDPKKVSNAQLAIRWSAAMAAAQREQAQERRRQSGR